MKNKMNRRITVIVCGTALLTAVAVAVALHSRRQPLEQGTVVATSDAVASVCGADEATADLYEARNDALRSIMRSRRLTKEDTAALLDYLASTNDAMRVERVAALKNDVMNLLRRQETPVEGLAATLIVMFEGGAHPPAVLDYCVQHLGVMQGGIGDDALRARVHGVLVKAARRQARHSAAAGRAETPHARPVRRRRQHGRPHRGDPARRRTRLRRGSAGSPRRAFRAPPQCGA